MSLDIPAAVPLVDLRARVDSWAGGVLLADAGPPDCPRCQELAAGFGWSSTAHVHTPAAQGQLLLSRWLKSQDVSPEQLGREKVTRRLGLLGLGRTGDGSIGRLSSPYVPRFDVLGPVAGYLAGWDNGPVAAWSRAESARASATAARHAAATSRDRRVARSGAAANAARTRELAPAAVAWWEQARQEWSLFVHDLELADQFQLPTTTITEQPGGLSWH